jgi:uncharacterized protein
MRLINKSKNTLLAEEIILADSLFKRMRGLLGRKELAEDSALLLNSIHTIFMRFSIDVLFVDKECRVIKAISALKPFNISKIYLSAKFAIELPVGTINSTSTSSGDILSLE